MAFIFSFSFGVYIGCLNKQKKSSNSGFNLEKENIKIFFSPNGGAREAIISEIKNAKSDIYIFAYAFNCPKIYQALLNAHSQGVKIYTFIDKSQMNIPRSLSQKLFEISDECYTNTSKIKIQHIKSMIIDSKVVITGSFNFTIPAEERNAENLLIINSEDLAIHYQNNWENYIRNFRYAKPVSRTFFKEKKAA